MVVVPSNSTAYQEFREGSSPFSSLGSGRVVPDPRNAQREEEGWAPREHLREARAAATGQQRSGDGAVGAAEMAGGDGEGGRGSSGRWIGRRRRTCVCEEGDLVLGTFE